MNNKEESRTHFLASANCNPNRLHSKQLASIASQSHGKSLDGSITISSACFVTKTDHQTEPRSTSDCGT